MTHFLSLLLLVNQAVTRPLPPTRTPVWTVHVFLSTECPISQQYVRELATLQRQFAPKGVLFRAWFPLRTDTPKAIIRFQKTYRLTFSGTPDPAARLAHRLQVRVTPEVVVVQADGQVRYRGAIDDWYVSLGKHRPAPTQPYLRDALDALLTGRPVLPVHTEAVGCLVE